ncbi:MAG TPA: hypothetical protein PLQ29_00085 [Spirochaetales bacterium]|nr:hypothetical protein [Spirochaetales bacterium]HPG85069.1 hypothetical protein [Spirochaetales bacterium]HPM73942.1 hypothetical protein [Spirochaetales bacterium]
MHRTYRNGPPSAVAFLAILFASAASAAAQDVGWAVSAACGPAVAFGGALGDELAAFEDIAGADARYATVFGAGLAGGADIGLTGPLRAAASIGLSRLGYAFWSPDAAALSYLSLWTAGVRLGLRLEPGDWLVGAGASLLFPVGPIVQYASLGGASVASHSEATTASTMIPGAYIEGSLALGRPFAIGAALARPRLGLELGLWPGGLVEDSEAWQFALSAVVGLDLERKAAR